MKRNLHNLLVLACIAVSCSATWAGTIYGNNATGGAPYVYVFDSATGAISNVITNLSGINGRGVVVVNNIMYYTTATTNSVYSYNLTTSTDMGSLFTVPSGALSTMAFDGTNFWIGDYSGTNHAYLYSPTGTLLNTISLADCTGFCDGLEYFVDGGGNARLISNEGDGGTPGIYDVYSTTGALITHDFINTGDASGTGIAYDGTDFYVSNIFQKTITVYDNTGAFIRTESLTGYGDNTPLVEDLSANYALVLTGTPEPGTFAMLGAGLLGLLGAVKSRKRS